MPINAQILDNPKSDRVRRIADLTRAKGRERSGRFLIEGPQSVREAVTWRPDVVQDLYVEVSQALEHPRIISSTLEKIVETSQDATIYVHYCTGDVMRRISPDAQGIAAVGNAESMHAGADDVELGKNGRAPQIAAIWQVRDPGNAGTVIRAADAAGCDAVIFVDDCVDVLNPKVIRSTAGSLFHLPVLAMRAPTNSSPGQATIIWTSGPPTYTAPKNASRKACPQYWRTRRRSRLRKPCCSAMRRVAWNRTSSRAAAASSPSRFMARPNR